MLGSDVMSDTGDDYRGDYKQAMDSALNGRIGFYADFDSQRQEEVWRLLSADRDRLLTFARRHAITIGKLEVRKTLKSPQPVYELIATGRDARVARADPARTSANPIAIPAVKDSPRSVTPSSAATAGFT